MNLDEFLLRPHPFFTGMSESHLRLLAESATQVHFTEGTRVFREGDPAEHFYLIQQGRIDLRTYSAGHPFSIQTLGSGEVLGWSWLFPPYCWHFGAWAEADTDAISFSAARLREDCEDDPTFGYALMKRVAELLIHRLQATRLKLVQAHKIDHSSRSPANADL